MVSAEQAANKAFRIGIALNLFYVVAELSAGFITHSLALITDAGHNFGDVISLVLSLLALRLSKVKGNDKFTYGYKKTTILAALANATILLIAVGILGYESIHRLYRPSPTQGGTIALIASAGILINAVSALLFYKTRKTELNARAAYLHLGADALVSAGVVAAGLAIKFTGWFWLDPLVSLAILFVILLSTWSLLKESLQLSLDAVPKEISMKEVEQVIRKNPLVKDVHHIHIWAMSTTENALTAHVVIDENMNAGQVKTLMKNLKHELLHSRIQHATLEIETTGNCSDR
jgi:cobalt-zinc-cadmium efflux system protein